MCGGEQRGERRGDTPVGAWNNLSRTRFLSIYLSLSLSLSISISISISISPKQTLSLSPLNHPQPDPDRALIAAGNGLNLNVTSLYLSHFAPPGAAARTLAVGSIADSIGNIIGPMLTQLYLINGYAPFWVAAAAALVASGLNIVLFFWGLDDRKGERSAGEGVRSVFGIEIAPKRLTTQTTTTTTTTTTPSPSAQKKAQSLPPRARSKPGSQRQREKRGPPYSTPRCGTMASSSATMKRANRRTSRAR